MKLKPAGPFASTLHAPQEPCQPQAKRMTGRPNKAQIERERPHLAIRTMVSEGPVHMISPISIPTPPFTCVVGPRWPWRGRGLRKVAIPLTPRRPTVTPGRAASALAVAPSPARYGTEPGPRHSTEPGLEPTRMHWH
eukprot:1971631-Rhodomonas_salina.1